MSPNTSKNKGRSGHIHFISSENTFSNDFIDGLMGLIDHNPENLPKIHLFLPNRRACRQVQVAFLRYFKGKPVLLPKMRPIGEMDNDDLEFQMAISANLHKSPELNQQELTIPPAMSPLHRTLLLAQLIGAMAKDRGADSHIAMAQELGKLMDQIHLHGLDMADLPNLVDDQALAQHWQITLEFLKILSDFWPKILDEKQKIDAADRRNRMIGQLCHFYDQHRPNDIIIAVAPHSIAKNILQLMDHISRLPNGHIIIPGLDPHIDQTSWDGLSPTHPQYVWKHVLNHLQIKRQDVGIWGDKGNKRAELSQPTAKDGHSKFTTKQWLLREIMRPAPTLERWADLSTITSLEHGEIIADDIDSIPSIDSISNIRAALDDWQLITCESPEQEAQIIAMALREQLETDGRTAALVTPDRHLARRVSAACRRWGITVDDSGGIPLHRERSGSWLLLTAQACLDGLSPLSLLSMLKHPLANPGGACSNSNDDQTSQLPQADFRRLVRKLEKAYLRGPAPSNGLDGLKKIAADHNDLKTIDMLDLIAGHVVPFQDQIQNGKAPFLSLLNAHIDMAEHLAGGSEHIWIGDDGEASALFLAELNEAAHLIPPVTGHEYIHIIRRLMEKMSVRAAFGAHPRLSILGRLESQLLDADFVILAGLNEGSWPPEPAKDPWMSRPMRNAYGLPSPDEEIGRAAFDFTQLLLRPNILMTRSLRVDGTPSVPARWLQRLDAVMNALNTAHHNNSDQPRFTLGTSQYMPWLQAMDHAKSIQPATQPAPCPPLAARPRKMGVTSIERWMADPYHIYAQKILRLNKLDPIEKDAQAAEYGEWIHHVLEKFVRAYPGSLTENRQYYLNALENIAREALPRPADDPRIIGFWWPRFHKMMQWYLDHELQWRQTARPHIPYLESKGYVSLPAKGGDFTLTAKVDRIDKIIASQQNLDDHIKADFAIIDYKTGSVPDKKSVLNGMRAQLPLEAIILEHKGFDRDIDITASSQQTSTTLTTSILTYWNFRDDPKKHFYADLIKNKSGDDILLEDVIQQSYDGVLSLINIFDDPKTPYISLPRAHLAPPADFQDYAHLARVKEWNATNGDQDG